MPKVFSTFTKRKPAKLRERSSRAIKGASRKRFSSWSLLCISLLVLGLVWYHPFFRIQKITCQLDGGVCPEVIQKDLQQYHHHQALTLQPETVETKYQSAVTQAKAVTAHVSFPHQLHLELESRTTLAQVQSATNSGYLLVSADFMPLSITDVPTPELFSIMYPQAYQVAIGEPITDSALLFALKVGSLLQASFIDFSIITIESPDQITVSLKDGLSAVFTSTLEETKQLTTLQVILSKATIEPGYTYIDVRFDQPVLRRDL